MLTGWPVLLRGVLIVAGALLVAVIVDRILFPIIRRIAARTHTSLDDIVLRSLHGPLKLILPLMALILALPLLLLPPHLESSLRHFLGLCLVGGIAWLAIGFISVVEEFVALRYSVEAADNLTARRIRTQTLVLRRILVVLICMMAIAVALMSFPSIRQVGASLLASAGLAGLVIGLAARPVIANLLAGIQLALSGPMRLDDVVIVEGEWGRIEEITTTYIVVRCWDLRRLVVPLSYFIEKPFQNWTRNSSDLIGTVFLYTDYTVPVEEVRKELMRILEGAALWDRKVVNLQVTDAKERTLELRALMSASDSGKAFDLRCQVREALIGFLQRNYPQSLPKVRAEIDGLPREATHQKEDGAGLERALQH